MTPNEFDALLAQGYNRIPVVCEVLADLDTPLSVYLKLVEGPFGFLFESVQGGEKWGRYSIIGLPCRSILRANGRQVTVETDGQLVESAMVEDPLAFVEQFKSRFRVPELPVSVFIGDLTVEKLVLDGAVDVLLDPIDQPIVSQHSYRDVTFVAIGAARGQDRADHGQGP